MFITGDESTHFPHNLNLKLNRDFLVKEGVKEKMNLQLLVNDLEIESQVNGDIENIRIEGIADSSLNVEKDFLFVAIKGFNSDGHEFIKEAIQKGASVIVGEEDISDSPIRYIKVKNSRKALGTIAKNFYGDPSKNKLLIGITGTNGKTTTSYLLKHILEKNGLSCSMIGTIQNVINGQVTQGVYTTPSSLVLQKLLSTSKDEVVIMEVSSHGLTQYRVEGLEFDYCLFTNLNHDHLDYHASMEEYFQAKTLLFDKLKDNGQAIINTDDFWGEKLAIMLERKSKEVYAISQSKDSHFKILNFNVEESAVSIKENNELHHIYSPMVGIHNLYNVTMAYATAKLLNISTKQIMASLPEFTGVKGRFETLKLSNGVTVVVDYAHTPDAIFHCLRTARFRGAERVFHIFGFRGDRDSSKRQEMVSITSELSDQYILTLDDLNSVSHKDMVGTLEYISTTFGNEKGTVIPDRTLALKQVIEQSERGDWVIITGKGHEKYQQRYLLPTESDQDTITYIMNQEGNKRQILE